MGGGGRAEQSVIDKLYFKHSSYLQFTFEIVLSFFTFTCYNCIAQVGFLPWEIRVSPGTASCDRVALPNLRCMLGVLVFP